MLGKPYKDIAQIITQASAKAISKSTVNSVIHRQLFLKFNVTSIEDLICRISAEQVLTSIPSSLIELKEGIFNLSFYTESNNGEML